MTCPSHEGTDTTSEERDIGVTVCSNLKQGAQCRKAARTAAAVLGQVSRVFHYRDRFTFVKLYKQYVRPHLEFAILYRHGAHGPAGQGRTRESTEESCRHGVRSEKLMMKNFRS
jgi:hypothetical protein